MNKHIVADIWPWRIALESQSTESELTFVTAHCNAAAEEIHIVTPQQSPWSTGMKNVFNLLTATCLNFKEEFHGLYQGQVHNRPLQKSDLMH